MKGWYYASRLGFDAAAWVAFWEFARECLNDRFGVGNWVISPEGSVAIHTLKVGGPSPGRRTRQGKCQWQSALALRHQHLRTGKELRRPASGDQWHPDLSGGRGHLRNPAQRLADDQEGHPVRVGIDPRHDRYSALLGGRWRIGLGRSPCRSLPQTGQAPRRRPDSTSNEGGGIRRPRDRSVRRRRARFRLPKRPVAAIDTRIRLLVGTAR